MKYAVWLVGCAAAVCGQRILTSSPLSIESSKYAFPGNSHGCGQISTEDLAELTLDMSSNSCGGGAIQCPRCFILHNPIRLSIKSCQAPPRTARCQETGVCPALDFTDVEGRLNEYVFINLSQGVVFVGSDASSFSTSYTTGGSDSIPIPPNGARTAICYQGHFYWS